MKGSTTTRTVNNAKVAKEGLESVGELKGLSRPDGEGLWIARFENGVLNFQNPGGIVSGINVINMYTESDIEMGDTIVVHVNFEL